MTNKQIRIGKLRQAAERTIAEACRLQCHRFSTGAWACGELGYCGVGHDGRGFTFDWQDTPYVLGEARELVADQEQAGLKEMAERLYEGGPR